MAEVRKQSETGSDTLPASSPVPAADAPTLAPAGGTETEARPTVPGYEIIEELGRGGMGVVYKARQLSLNRFVALKMILAGPYAGPEQLARFRLEAEAVAALQHPGIVQIFEIGSHAGHAYLALEYIGGGTLSRHCTGQPLPPMQAADLIEALARAVHYAHQHGIIHRDLKPGNVLLNETGEPKITDFGLAKRLDVDPASTATGPQTQSGAILGTPAYMAPEQAGGKRGTIGPATDVYALGAILYELLTGRPPFEAGNQVDLIFKVVTEEPVPPTRLQPKLPRDLEAVCLKCLQKDPERRYPTAEFLADDLERFLQGEPTQARPMSGGQRFRRWAWRRRWWLAGFVVAALLLLLLTCSLGLNLVAMFFMPGTVYTSPPVVTVSEGTPAVAVERVVLPDDLDLVPRDGVMFVSIRVADLWKRKDVRAWNTLLSQQGLLNLGEMLAAFGRAHDARVEDIGRLTLVTSAAGGARKPSYVAIVKMQKPFSHDEFAKQLTKRGLAAHFDGRTWFGPGPTGHENVCIVSDSIFVFSPNQDSLEDWLDRLPSKDSGGPLRAALEMATQGHHVVAATVISPQVREIVLLEMSDSVFDFFGRRAPPHIKRPNVEPLLAEAETFTLTADLMSRADGDALDGLVVDVGPGFKDQASLQSLLGMEELRGFLGTVLKQHASGELEGVPPIIAEEVLLALRAAPPIDSRTAGHLQLKMTWAPDWPASAVAALKEEGQRVRSQNNLKQLALGIIAYSEAHKAQLPPAALTDKTGKPVLSWRVAILPFLNQRPLYDQFKLDEPWDSEQNKKLLAKMPACFEPPLKPKGWQPNTTFYRVFVGQKTLFPPGKTVLYPAGITDGTSNTLMVVEAAEAVPWTKPQDLPYDPDRPLPMLGGIFHDGFQAVMADGSTGRFLPKKILPATLRAMITPAGGERFEEP